VLACLIALGGCGDDGPEVKTGQWGGLGTELNVTTSYPAAYPQGFVINGPGGAEYRSLTYGVGFVEKEGNPPVGCVCSCVGCP
jgi:hypothetical protein